MFFDTFLEEIDKYKLELRLVFQVTTSPVYGPRMREKAKDFKEVYAEYIQRLSEILNCSPETLIPVIYMLISILVDYVVWEDYEVSKLQLESLYETLMTKLKNETNQ